MENSFESPRFLIRQTKEQVMELHGLLTAFFAKVTHQTVVEVEPLTQNRIYKIVFDSPVPERVRHIAATAINDLRHALDQAFCAAFEALTGREAARDCYFPIANSPPDLKGKLVASGIPEEIHALFLKFSSYPTSQEYGPGNDFFCDLNKAARGKHRVSCKVRGVIPEVNADSITIKNPVAIEMPPKWNDAKHEAIIAITYPDGWAKFSLKAHFVVLLDNAGPLTDKPVVPLLMQLAELIGAVIDEIAARTEGILRERKG